MSATVERQSENASPVLPEHMHIIAEALERLRFGVIQLTVHEGKLMQVDVTERRRFT